jgi:hypothetical protein
MRILIDVIYATGVEGRGATLNPVHGVSLFQKEIGQIRAVLTGNPGD